MFYNAVVTHIKHHSTGHEKCVTLIIYLNFDSNIKLSNDVTRSQ